MSRAISLLFLLAVLGVSYGFSILENLEQVVPGDLELDPEFQKRFPYLIPSNVDSHIVGGEESIPHSRPYMVGMFIPGLIFSSFCGGSIINARTVLTAAHCVDGRRGNLTLHFGAHNMPPTRADTYVVTVTSGDIVIHPGWNRSTLMNDVAIIRLDESLTFNERIFPVLLPRDNSQDYHRNQSLVSGWGRPSDSASGISPVLREASTHILSPYPCSLAFMGMIADSHICTTGQDGRGSCNGDSGGPLVVNGVQIGIVSFGSAYGCATGYPAVYARTTSYLEWIRSNSAVVPITTLSTTPSTTPSITPSSTTPSITPSTTASSSPTPANVGPLVAHVMLYQ